MLPSCYIRTPENDSVPLLSYGLAFTEDDATRFALRRNLMTEDEVEKDDGILSTLRTSFALETGANLRSPKLVRPMSLQYHWVIEIVNSHNFNDPRRYSLEEQRRRLEHAAKLLDNGQRPLWWWSAENRFGPDPTRDKYEWSSSFAYPDLVAPEFKNSVSEETAAEILREAWEERSDDDESSTSGSSDDSDDSYSSDDSDNDDDHQGVCDGRSTS